MATSTVRAAVIAAVLVFGIVVLANAFPSGGASDVTTSPTAPDPTTTVPTTPPTTTTTTAPPATIEGAELQVLNGTSVTGLAATTAQLLRDAGAIVPEDADHVGDYEGVLAQTELHYRAEAKAVAELLRDQFFNGAKLVVAGQDELPANVLVSVILGQDYADAQG